ncbi:acyltransferase family protein [Paraburkholderia sp. CNPSo 3157]|uniref:Acyltransferase family protein n=1 Tax=Paraburkholderia franconis TaxID=2654983 RepID=A0A7X1N7N6_9BURK|nr:acyltransferase [Paraburkholderia franconis]MPW16897.1 acyltransferase family protein [Paraburkholderia franconis]
MNPSHGDVADLKPLTSLRFVAAMMIVVLHSKLYFSWPWLQHAPGSLVQGVSFFFVLSGFILSHVYTSKPFPGYGRFMFARFARLWPVHIFALLMLVTFVRPDSITFDGPGMFSKWYLLASNLTLTQSLFPFTAYTFSYNSASWSISAEAFFYLAFPLLLINIKRTWHWKMAGSALVAVVIAAIYHRFPSNGDMDQITIASALYANPLVRGFEFCLGMSTWVLWDRYIKRSQLSLAAWTAAEGAILLIITAWLSISIWPVRNGIPPSALQVIFHENGSSWAFAILIAVAASGRGLFGKALSAKPLAFLGHVSFSIYMLHQILMKMFVTWNQAQTVSTVAFLAALIFIASASYLMIEKPVQRLLMKRHRPATSQSIIPQAGGAKVHTPSELVADQP